jgi:hypothetical protein
MSFTIYSHDGMKCITWFKDADALIKSMIANPKDAYWRNQ